MIKYRGGKSKELVHMMPHVPEGYDCYIEPFVGGGAMFWCLEPKKAIINDLNDKLIGFYRGISEDPIRVRRELKELQEAYVKHRKEFEQRKAVSPNERVHDDNETMYYQLREMYNHPEKSSYAPASLYYYINKTAYSGMIRYNKSGEYNVPYGRYANFNTEIITDSHIELLQRTTIMCGHYRNAFDLAEPNDFMFLDPPYDCVFTEYGNVKEGEGFGESEHRQLAEDFKNLSCKTLLVIGKTPLTVDLYRGRVLAEYDKTYSVNIRNRFKSESVHLLVANY